MGVVGKEVDLASSEATLKELVKAFAPAGTTLLIVDSAHEWAVERGSADNNPFRQAIAFPDHSLIVMTRILTETHARSSASILTIGPAAHEALAQDLSRYAQCLLLHEIAHLNRLLDEPTADQWALARLNEILEAAGEEQV